MSSIDPRSVVTLLAADPDVGRFVDTSLSPPAPYRGSGTIRLIILGQDPTVKRRESRRGITTVLNLDRPGALRNYLSRVCAGMGLDLAKDVYATNFVNTFFTVPPASVKERDVLGIAGGYWRPILEQQLAAFPRAPILALGQPLLRQLAFAPASRMVRDYWGYVPHWKAGGGGPQGHLPPEANSLRRHIFPFPHQPSSTKLFYSQRLSSYIDYMRASVLEPDA